MWSHTLLACCSYQIPEGGIDVVAPVPDWAASATEALAANAKEKKELDEKEKDAEMVEKRAVVKLTPIEQLKQVFEETSYMITEDIKQLAWERARICCYIQIVNKRMS